SCLDACQAHRGSRAKRQGGAGYATSSQDAGAGALWPRSGKFPIVAPVKRRERPADLEEYWGVAILIATVGQVRPWLRHPLPTISTLSRASRSSGASRRRRFDASSPRLRWSRWTNATFC